MRLGTVSSTFCVAVLCACCGQKGEDAKSVETNAHPVSSPNGEAAGSNEKARAPDKYGVRLSTSKGEIVIDVERAWSPRGADRFFELVKEGYFEDVAFFRVVDGFMAQAGIHGDPAVNREWRSRKIEDDPVVERNLRGTVSFATSGKNSRTTQFFINFSDNSRLDGMGFSPFGKVRDMAVVDQLYSGYGEGAPRGMGPSQGRIQQEGNAYLKAEFPKLDYILKAQII